MLRQPRPNLANCAGRMRQPCDEIASAWQYLVFPKGYRTVSARRSDTDVSTCPHAASLVKRLDSRNEGRLSEHPHEGIRWVSAPDGKHSPGRKRGPSTNERRLG